MRGFFGELKRRNVFKVGAAYAVAGWVLVQAAAIMLPTYHAPEWVMPASTSLVIVGFPIALILAWAFQVTPEGVRNLKLNVTNDTVLKSRNSSTC